MKSIWYLLASLTVFLAAPAHAGRVTARLLTSNENQFHIDGLVFKARDLVISFGKPARDAIFSPHVRVPGRFIKNGWKLTRRDRTLAQSTEGSQGSFSVELPLTGPHTYAQFEAVGPTGQTQIQRISVEFPEWDELKSRFDAKPPRRVFVSTALGISSISYQETGVSDFSMIATTLKISFQHLLFPPYWDFAANGFVTLLPLSSNQKSVSVRYVGVNARLGYALPFVAAPWRLTLAGGAFFTTMIVTDNNFGYRNLFLPQFYPSLRRTLKNGDGVYTYLKYVPLAAGFGLSLVERELAFGFGWDHPLRNGHPVTMSFDFSDLKIGTIDTTAFHTRSGTLGISYGL